MLRDGFGNVSINSASKEALKLRNDRLVRFADKSRVSINSASKEALKPLQDKVKQWLTYDVSINSASKEALKPTHQPGNLRLNAAFPLIRLQKKH